MPQSNIINPNRVSSQSEVHRRKFARGTLNPRHTYIKHYIVHFFQFFTGEVVVIQLKIDVGSKFIYSNKVFNKSYINRILEACRVFNVYSLLFKLV